MLPASSDWDNDFMQLIQQALRDIDDQHSSLRQYRPNERRRLLGSPVSVLMQASECLTV